MLAAPDGGATRVIADGPPDRALNAETIGLTYGLRAEAVIHNGRRLWVADGPIA